MYLYLTVGSSRFGHYGWGHLDRPVAKQIILQLGRAEKHRLPHPMSRPTRNCLCNLYAEGCSYAPTRAQSWRAGNATFIQTSFAFISLMTYKGIPLSWGALSFVFWVLTQTNLAAD